MNTPQHEGYVDAEAFHQEFSLSVRTFFLWIKEGKLTPFKPSKRKTLVRRADVNRVIEATEVKNPIDNLVDEVMAEIGAGT